MMNPCPKCGEPLVPVRGVLPASCGRCGLSRSVGDIDDPDADGLSPTPAPAYPDELADEAATIVARPAVLPPPPSPRSLSTAPRAADPAAPPPRVRSINLSKPVGGLPASLPPQRDPSPAPALSLPPSPPPNPPPMGATEGAGPVVAAEAPLGPIHEPALPAAFELQLAQGDSIQGPYDRVTLREMLYLGRLTGDERVRVPGKSAFTRLADHPEFAVVLAVSDRVQAPVAARAARGGWKRTDAGLSAADAAAEVGEPTTPPEQPSLPAPTPAAPPPPVPRPAPVVDMRRKPPYGLIIGLILLLGLAGVAIKMLIAVSAG